MRIFIRLVLILLLALAAMVTFFWAPDVPVESLKARWAAAPSTFISVQGMPVHVRDEGPRDDPTPLVLIHGTAASLHTWDGWALALSRQHRVIRFDLPGFGLTGPTPDGDYRLERYTQFVAATLDALGLKRVVLGGNSLGGQIAWATALAFPERVERLILVDAAGYAFRSASVPLGFRAARLPGINRLMENVLPRALIELSLKNVYGNPALVTPDLIDRYFDLTRRAGNRRALAQRFEQNQPGEMSERLPTLRLPVLILWGARDRLIPLENSQHFKQDIAGSQLLVFDDLGHVPQEEDPQRTVQVVSKFIAITRQ